MFNNHDHQTKVIYASLGIVAAFILVIVVISVLVATFSNKEEARVVNEYDAVADQTSSEDLTRIKKSLYNLLKRTAGADHDFDVVARWDTVETKIQGNYPVTTLLVDVDEYQQTYQVSFDQYSVEITCPKLGESKYPDSFCIGNDGDYDDSIYVVFGSTLPLTVTTDTGATFTISRNTKDIRNLNVSTSVCDNDPAGQTAINQAVDQYISSLGASPTLFERYLVPAPCSAHSE